MRHKIIEKPTKDDEQKISLDAAMNFVNNGAHAAPRHCAGVPPQCSDWIEAASIPQSPLKSDFHLMARNVGRLRRNGYCHVVSSSQLSCIAAMPGSISVKHLILIATLLGQPLVTNAQQGVSNTDALFNVTHHTAGLVQHNLDNPTPGLTCIPASSVGRA